MRRRRHPPAASRAPALRRQRRRLSRRSRRPRRAARLPCNSQRVPRLRSRRRRPPPPPPPAGAKQPPGPPPAMAPSTSPTGAPPPSGRSGPTARRRGHSAPATPWRKTTSGTASWRTAGTECHARSGRWTDCAAARWRAAGASSAAADGRRADSGRTSACPGADPDCSGGSGTGAATHGRFPWRAAGKRPGRPQGLHRTRPSHRRRSLGPVVHPSQRGRSIPLRRAGYPDRAGRQRHPHHRDSSRWLPDHHHRRPRRPVDAPHQAGSRRPRDHHHRQRLRRSARRRRILCRPAAACAPHSLQPVHRRSRRCAAGPDLRHHGSAAGGADRAALFARRNPLQPVGASLDAVDRPQQHQFRHRIVGDSARSGGEAAGDRRRPQPRDPAQPARGVPDRGSHRRGRQRRRQSVAVGSPRRIPPPNC